MTLEASTAAVFGTSRSRNILTAFGGPGPEGVSFGAHCGGAFVGSVVVAVAWLRGVDLRGGARPAWVAA